jgi:hypothetical protein
MENLKTELLEKLKDLAEMVFNNGDNTGFAFWTSEELTFNGSLRKNLNEAGFGEFEKELKALQRKDLLDMFTDDGWLHLKFNNELLPNEFLNKLEFDCDFTK